MRIVKIVTVVLVGVLAFGFLAGPALGQTCDNNYTGLDGGIWQEPLNWDEGHYPTPSEVACIPANKKCVIVYDFENYPVWDVYAKAIVLAVDGDDRAELELETPTSLTIYEDSTIDGILSLQEKSKLFIHDNLTITGNGGEIVGIPPTEDPAAVIEHADDQDLAILTLAPATAGSRDTSLVVHGSLRLAVALRNRVYVVADNGDLKLETTTTKWGLISGHWIAETGGDLIVNSPVRGPASWLIQDQYSSMTIMQDCRLLTGTFDMTDGVLIANQDFQTTGNVSVKSIADGQGGFTEPEIRIDADAEVSFGS